MADSEVTTALTETIAAFLKPAEPRSDGVFYLRDADELAAHLASVLASVFVVLPKDQLHREWTVRSGVNVHNARGMDEKRARYVAEKWPESFTAITRLVGSWGPVTDKEQG